MSSGEFFFDNGSISADEIMYQMKFLVLGFEMAGAKLVGIIVDRGEENTRGGKLLWNYNYATDKKYWLK